MTKLGGAASVWEEDWQNGVDFAWSLLGDGGIEIG